MRIRQYAKQINKDLIKTSRDKKKQARLYNTWIYNLENLQDILSVL